MVKIFSGQTGSKTTHTTSGYWSRRPARRYNRPATSLSSGRDAAMNSLLTTAVFLLAQTAAPAPRIWDVNGVPREALVFVPASKIGGKLPLVFDFHGHGGTHKNAVRAHHLHESWPEAI